MTSTAESSSQGEEADVFRQFLADTVQEIATSVSFPRFQEILKPLTSPPKELHDHAQQVIVQSMEPVVDGLSRSNVGKKLKDLNELTNQYPLECEEARIPKTIHETVLALEGQALENRKAKLLEAIAAVDKQNEELCKVIEDRRNALKKQKDVVQHINI